MIKTISQNTEAEVVIKKSRFIANAFRVENEKEAKNIINDICKKYYDAKHNCYAYVIQEANMLIEKSSDNGEPSGTAGAPLCDVIKKQGLCNVLIVVTRYFGGILLGTGGLVKAYTESATKALSKASICNMELGNYYQIEIEYDELKTLKHYCKQFQIKEGKIEYAENVRYNVYATEEKIEKLRQKYVNLRNFKVLKQNQWI